MNALDIYGSLQKRSFHGGTWLYGAALCLVCLPMRGKADTPATDTASKSIPNNAIPNDTIAKTILPETVKGDDANAPLSSPLLAGLRLSALEKKITVLGDAAGADIPPKARPDADKDNKAEEQKTPAKFHPSLTFNGEMFFGITNVTGLRARNNDGVWGGYAGAYPSNLSLNWNGGESRTVRLSIGVGDLYTARGTSLRQPMEAFYQAPGKAGSSFTVGKFFVPFASQEWEYEPKWGGMVQGIRGRVGYAASLNYNNLRNDANAYLRLVRQWNGGTTLGLSVGVGRGIFSGTSHDTAFGVNVTQEFKGIRLNSEYSIANGPQGAFQFAFGKLTFTNLGRIEPYVGAYYTGDHAKELTNFHSVLGGVNYHITKAMALEGAVANTSGRNVFWFQSHVAF